MSDFVRAGFIPLTDAAVLIAAADRGFAAAEHIELELVRDVSWANVRDRLLLGDFHVAHLLAPIAIAATLGIGYPPVPIVVPASLGLNGSSIILANDLHAALRRQATGDLADPAISGAALAAILAERRAQGLEKLTFATVFPFSTHTYLLHFWLAAAGIDPDRDVHMVVVPPPYMVESLSHGHVHGFCVGAPWPSVGVAAGLGHILHFATDLFATCPDKVLAVKRDWLEANGEVHARLLRAIIRAAAWCAAPENRQELAEMLAQPRRLGVAPGIIRHGLDGRLIVAPDGTTRDNPQYFRVDPLPAIRPDPVHAAWFFAQMVRWRQTGFTDAALATTQGVYRPDLFDAAHASLGIRGPARDHIGAFAGPAFDPNDIGGYLARWMPERRAGE